MPISCTGELRPQTQSGFDLDGANAIDVNDLALDSTYGIEAVVGSTAEELFLSNFTGEPLPHNAEIVGLEMLAKVGYTLVTNECVFMLSLDGGTTYSKHTKTLTTPAATGASTTISTLGSSTDRWGIAGYIGNEPAHRWNDYSNLMVKLIVSKTNPMGVQSFFFVYGFRIKIYYKIPELFLKTGTLKIKSGTLTIK